MSSFGITPQQLEEINQDQEFDQNWERFNELGGVTEIAQLLCVDLKNGLSADEKELRYRENIFGVNEMPKPEEKSWLSLFFDAFNDSTVIILMISAIISLIVGLINNPSQGWIEGVAILSAVLIVAIVTATNDYTKEKQFQALNQEKDNINVKVTRDGFQREIEISKILVGDIVSLYQGDKIPADGLFIRGNDCACYEAALTGEPEDIIKSENTDPFFLSGCQLISGACDILIIAVGEQSRWGRIKAKLAVEQPNTPLQDKLDDLASLIGYVGMGFALMTFVAHMIMYMMQPQELRENIFEYILNSFIIGITIIVVAVPEGLPLAVTISLAYSTKKMLNDKNLIRVLAACETMGNATTICSDKTGTLTENKMTVVAGYFAGHWTGLSGQRNIIQQLVSSNKLSPQVLELLAIGISVNSTALIRENQVIGNRTEVALLLMLESWSIDYEDTREKFFDLDQGDRIFPFSSTRKRSSVLTRHPDGSDNYRLFCKGAAEILVRESVGITRPNGKTETLSNDEKKKMMELITNMSENALRTVCIGHRDFDEHEISSKNGNFNYSEMETNLIIDAIIGIMDPLRPDVKQAISDCQHAGIMVRMVTGDNILTAKAIAKDCGILTNDGIAMEGPEFRKLTPKQLDDILPRLQVLARSSPTDKHLLVLRLNGHEIPKNRKEWEQQHPNSNWNTDRDRLLPGYFDEWKANRDFAEVVSVTGDGTNDAPALRAADVGLSMGLSGTDVAKEASDIVILDDKFSSIVKAILWGRCVFDNICKFLQFQLTVNIVALTVTFVGAIAGYEPPLNAVMMLWVNLIMDTMGALALGTEPPTCELLNRLPYKRTASLVNELMWRNIIIQSIFQLFLLFFLLFNGAQFFNVIDGSIQHFTLIFNTFVFCQIFNEFNARKIGNMFNVFDKLSKNFVFQEIIVFTIIVQVLIVQFGGNFTKTQCLTLEQWMVTIAFGFLSLPIGALMRLIPITENPNNFASLPSAGQSKSRNNRNSYTNGNHFPAQERNSSLHEMSLFQRIMSVSQFILIVSLSIAIGLYIKPEHQSILHP